MLLILCMERIFAVLLIFAICSTIFLVLQVKYRVQLVLFKFVSLVNIIS